MTAVALIAPHQGLGDHILCNGLYRSVSEKFEKIFIPVKNKYFLTIQNMFMDEKKINILRFPDKITDHIISVYIKVIPNNSINILRLGNYERNFLKQPFRFDEYFYFQAGVDFNSRWNKFKINRNLAREISLFSKYGIEPGNYIFLHEDIPRKYTIDKKYISKKLKIIYPRDISENIDIVDYILILEKAKEIHCIESSFAALVESLPSITCEKYAHRYSRPEAKNNWKSEFTYRSNWNIIK